MPFSAIVSGAVQGVRAGLVPAMDVAGEAAGVGLGASAVRDQLAAPNGDEMVHAGAGQYDDPYGVATGSSRTRGRMQRNATIVNPLLVLIPLMCFCMCCVMMFSSIAAMS